MARRRPNPTATQVLIAVLVLLAPVVAIYLLFARVPPAPVNALDWQPVVAQARAEAPYRVAAPHNLPASWVAVRARWTPLGKPALDGRPAVGNMLQLGFLTTEQVYVGFDQRDTDSQGLIRTASRDGRADGESRLAGTSWKRYVSSDQRTRALVRTEAGSTVVVSGDLPYPALEAFATTLE